MLRISSSGTLKSFCVGVLIILCSYTASAQTNEPYIYGEIGGGDGTKGIFQMSMNMIFSYDNIISFSYYYAGRKATNTPSDYSPGWFSIPAYPQQYVSTFALSYGKVLFFNSPYERFVVKGGLCMGVVSNPVSFGTSPSNALFGPSYSYTSQKTFIVGLVINPVMEFLTGHRFGFSIGPYINANAICSVAGVETSMMFGKLRSKKDRR